MSEVFQSELDDPVASQMARDMAAEGVSPYQKVQVDYFAIGEDSKTVLPDGVSFITHKVLSEGDRKRYLKAINRDLKIQKGTGDAIMRVSAGEDRTALLRVAITGWNLQRGGQPLPFTPQNLEALLDGPVQILELVERDVKKNNPWLFSDMTPEDIDEEIERLQEMRAELVEAQEGKSSSASS